MSGHIGTCALLLVVTQSYAQIVDPSVYRGREDVVFEGVSDSNLIDLRMTNHGELASPSATGNGSWPKGIGGPHVDGIGIIVTAKVRGERSKWADRVPEWTGVADPVMTPVAINYGLTGRRESPTGAVWGWLPIPGFANPDRTEPATNDPAPQVASSDDPTTWPDLWPDRLSELDQGWPGRWNGLLGPDSLIAGRETYYVMDDMGNGTYVLDPATGLPNSPEGVFYPDPSDSTVGGLGLQLAVRTLAFRHSLVEDVLFLNVEVANAGGTEYDSLFFALYVNGGLGMEQGDENMALETDLQLVFAWDQDGVGQDPVGGFYALGYVGLALLDAPSGLTGAHLGSAPFYEVEGGLLDDAWLWDRLYESQFQPGTNPDQVVSDVDPAALLSSGPYAHAPGERLSFTAALVFGNDENDLFMNLARAEELREAGYSLDVMMPKAPVLHVPAREASSVSIVPTFAWSSVPRADSYELWVASDSLLRQRAISPSPVTADTTYTLPDEASLEPGTTYFWAVRGIGTWPGPRSDVRSFTTASEVQIGAGLAVPRNFVLYDNYPNPFSSSTTIRIDVAVLQHVRLTVHDLLGREVRTLISRDPPPGTYDIQFDASGLPSGPYLYRLETDGFTQTRMMVLLR